MKKYLILWAGLFSLLPVCAQQKDSISSVVDEVIWVVGDEAILKSEVEVTRIQAAMEGMRWNGDPDCAIPEHLAVQKLFLHQAAIDSIEVKETEISAATERRLDYMIQQIGSREKLEEYRKQSMSQMRQSMHDDLRDQLLIQRMKEHLVKDLVVTPAEVCRYFKNMPTDSIPYVPTEVEVQIITQTPRVDQTEINRVKEQLREFTERINRGEASFSTLARLYSQDGSARNGGELGYTGRGQWVPEFANVAFNLTDPKKVSKIVETEFGFHIIQLIDKRGDKVNARHILLKPEISDSAIAVAITRLDSIANDIREDKFTFEEAATYGSDDKDTRNNRGIMTNKPDPQTSTSKFRMQDLPQDVARVVDTMQVNQVSRAFQMVNDKGKTVCAIVKLKSRVEGHKARITEDFQIMKDVVVGKMREEKLHKWVVDKIKATYVRINDNYRDCEFEYQGWIR